MTKKAMTAGVRSARHPSSSTEQQVAESQMIRAFLDREGIRLTGDEVPMEIEGLRPDWLDPDRRLVIEAYAHYGRAKGGQVHKVRSDLLKLVFLEKQCRVSLRKVMLFCDEKAASILKGESWAARAAKAFDIEIAVVDMPYDVKTMIQLAQARQRMVNPE